MINAAVGSLADGTMGIDLTTPLNPISAKQYVNKGVGFVVRYIGRDDGRGTFVDLTQDEGQAIVDAGLGLCVVQHPLADPWSPTGKLGQQFGAGGARLAGDAGLPTGVTVWLDLEGVAAASPAQNVIDYCNEWYDEISAVGFVPGVYIGAAPGLSADEIYWDLNMQNYWRGGSSVKAGVPVEIPNRGYQMIQRINGKNAAVDTDVTHADNFGGTVSCCVAR